MLKTRVVSAGFNPCMSPLGIRFDDFRVLQFGAFIRKDTGDSRRPLGSVIAKCCIQSRLNDFEQTRVYGRLV